MNNKSDKMDRQGARTVADLELKFNMGKSFAEAVGITDPSRMTLEDARKVITAINENLESISLRVKQTAEGVEEAKAQIVLAVTTDSEGKPYAVISEKADYIEFESGQIVIKSDNFTLGANGDARFSGTLNGAIINTVDNSNTKVVQLVDSSIQFYEDDIKTGQISCSLDNNAVILTGNLLNNGELYQHGATYFNKNDGIYMNAVPTFTGYVKLNQVNEVEYRCLKFINGLCMGVENVNVNTEGLI